MASKDRLAGVHTESLDPNNVLISFASPRPDFFQIINLDFLVSAYVLC